MFSTSSLLHLCCVSVDRYVAITDPFNYDRKVSSRFVGWLLIGVWTASALLSHVPIHLGWHAKHPHPGTGLLGVCRFEVNQVRHAVTR